MILSAAQVTPAHLWIGNHDHLMVQTYQWLQAFFNTCNACQVCASCRSIVQRQHHAITWLTPGSSLYVLEDIELLLHTISFALESEQHYFFVIEHADRLTAACSNRLLKTVEEPPLGYHFIFLAERAEIILPTLASRCIIKKWTFASSSAIDSLCSFFMTTSWQSPHTFFQELEKRKPSEQTTQSLLDDILLHWVVQARQAYVSGDAKKLKQALHMIAIVRSYLNKPLMPGSSKLVWRDLFLQMHCG
jgi:hypothetical protein